MQHQVTRVSHTGGNRQVSTDLAMTARMWRTVCEWLNFRVMVRLSCSTMRMVVTFLGSLSSNTGRSVAAALPPPTTACWFTGLASLPQGEGLSITVIGSHYGDMIEDYSILLTTYDLGRSVAAPHHRLLVHRLGLAATGRGVEHYGDRIALR
jgi:hypothetical protein